MARESLTASDLAGFLTALAEEMPGHEQQLRDLDARIGDGDLGVTVTLGTRAMREGLAGLAEADPGTLLARSGMNFNRAAASTFGVVLATALMRAGQAVKGQEQITVADLARMGEAAAQGVSERGGAQVGDKTILDVIVPLTERLQEAAAEGLDMPGALAAAAVRCREALAATEQMRGKHGRAGWHHEKSVGVPDPGSVAVCLMVECLARCVAEQAGE